MLITFSIQFLAYGQYNETIRTARPGQAVGPFTTGKYVIQIQSGYTFSDYENNITSESGDFSEYTTSLRYGLTERIEIRSAFKLRSDKVKLNNAPNEHFRGLSFWNVGIRYNLITGSGFKPSLGIQADAKLTAINEAYKAENLAPRFILIHGQRLSKTFRLTTNWALTWTGNNGDVKGNYVINIAFPISEKIGGFIENYGEVFRGDLDSRWDTGLSYLANNDLQFDVSGGFGKNDGLNDWFIDAGVSWRIKLKE